MPKKGPRDRAQGKSETRERIKAAAFELFTKKGFEETTTKAVAERAKVASGTVFVHARDKVDLLCLVMHDLLVSASEAQFETLPKGLTVLEELLHVFRGVFRMYGEHSALAAAFVKHLPSADGPNGQRVSAMTFAFLHRIALLLRAAQERGEIAADVPLELAAQNVFGLYYFSLTGWLSGFTSLETALDPHLRSMFELQLRGFAPRP